MISKYCFTLHEHLNRIWKKAHIISFIFDEILNDHPQCQYKMCKAKNVEEWHIPCWYIRRQYGLKVHGTATVTCIIECSTASLAIITVLFIILCMTNSDILLISWKSEAKKDH